MMKKLAVKSKLTYRRSAVAAATLSVVALLSPTLGIATLKDRFVINTTSSMPIGIYEITDKPVVKGSIVGACVPESFSTLARERNYVGEGRCNNGLRPVMKHVAALSGDSVEVGLRGVSVNGHAIENTRVMLRDAIGNTVPNQIGKHRVGKDEFWLVSNGNTGCFDSRYFGPVTEILGVVEPWFTRNTLCKFSPINLLGRCSGDSQ